MNTTKLQSKNTVLHNNSVTQQFEQIHKHNSEDNETRIELNLQREDIPQAIKMYKGKNIKRTIFIRKIICNIHRYSRMHVQ
jgi:hypothetical protein